MLVDAYNAFEVALWTVLGVVVAIRHRRSKSRLRRVAALATGLLFLFAVSDVIEMQTGAWWRPWPLLVLKGACLVGLASCAHRLLSTSRGRE